MKTKLIVLSCFMSLQAFGADSGLSPSSLKLTIYKFAVSTSVYCTNLITVVDNGTSPLEVEFVGGSANLGSGTLASGTYPCVVIEMSDNVKFTPDANSTSGHCLTSTQSTIDICRSDNSGVSTLINGTAVTCTGTDPSSPIANKVAMYLSTATTGSGDNFNPPIASDTNRGMPLGTALVVSGNAVGQFRLNATGQVQDSSGACGLNAPDFTFSKL